MAEYVFIPQGNGPATELEKDLLITHLKGHKFGETLMGSLNSWELYAYQLNEGEIPNLKIQSVLNRESELTHLRNVVKTVTKLIDGMKCMDTSTARVLNDVSRFIKCMYLRKGQQITTSTQNMTLNDNYVFIYFQLFNHCANSARVGAKKIQLKAEETNLTERQLRYLGANQDLYTIDDAFVRFSVIDDGRGIVKEDLPRIYEPGFSRRGSTGISLALTDLVCKTLHGYERVESEVGKGTTFELYVPKERKERTPVRQLELPF